MLGGGPTATPTVGMTQVQNYISIQEVERSPITEASCNVTFVNINGTLIPWSTHQGLIQDINADDYLSGGDTITFSTTWTDTQTTSHTGQVPYTVSIIYGGDSIGTAKFIPI